MTNDDHESPNEWTGNRAQRWVNMAEKLERQLAPVSTVLFEAAGLRAGERVLDIGCGTGPTTRQAASAVTATGAVTGLDISGDMLALARSTPGTNGAAPITWVEADLTTWSGAPEPFDVAISRFGVMFFLDPDAAFANLRRLVAPGGRLALIAWADRTESELFQLPLSVILDHLDPAPRGEVPPPDWGPFSLGHPEVVSSVLTHAGFQDVNLMARPMSLHVGGGLSPEEAARTSLDFGPTRILVEDLPAPEKVRLAQAIAEVYRHRVDEQGLVVLGATPVVITAEATGDA